MAIVAQPGNDAFWVTLSSSLEIRTPSFGEAIRFLRHAVALSQEALSDRSDLHVTHISELEQGRGNPNHQTLHRLARGLDVPPAYISTLEDIFERRRKREAQDD
jgi:transcriptional regulator with XRE-family HTH domain